MKVLMLVNWKIVYSNTKPIDKQPPDYCISGKPYWFYKHFEKPIHVDVLDISSFVWLEHFEKEKLRFYVFQALKAIPKLNKYDLIVSHGMQSGIVLSLFRRLFKTKAKHIVFDIGSFSSASERGFALKLMQFASKSIDGIIYHTSSQKKYYETYFPWIISKSQFIRFGPDLDFFNSSNLKTSEDSGKYILCVGYSKRDWNTLVNAYQNLKTDIKLRLIGHVENEFNAINGIEQMPSIPIHDLMNQIHNALFSVLPLKSFNYSYGQMTLMQQMALGKCVVAARVPSLVDYVEDSKTAILYEASNPSALTECMRLLIKNPELRISIGQNAQAYLADRCNEKTMAMSIEKFFYNVLAENFEKH